LVIPNSYDIDVRAVCYPGLTFAFDIARDFNYELSNLLYISGIFNSLKKAFLEVQDFTLYAEANGSYYDIRLDKRFLYMSMTNPHHIKLRLRKYTYEERKNVEGILN
jgi:hypothetical protein